FLLILPFVPVNKQNAIGWLAGRSDEPHRGQLHAFLFPKERLVYGPFQIEARINQDPEISQRLTLWGQKGSEVLRGNLLVVPIDDSLLYVEPLYLVATENRLPELKRVIAAFGSKVVMDLDLQSALNQLFGEGPPPTAPPPAGAPAPAPSPPAADTASELAERASRLLEQAQERARAGDWAGYGQALKELEDTLSQLVESLRR
ncbi:MAG: UPF0182 family protein, partial [Acetobacteraceae bacterium]|nr:UPF0182 family protein [Acetobacteraceae bacterium]